ncbi:MAG: nickel pincer cofactor biosynthesis protein LarC [Bacteroidetes bacterium]|nr:MAG: nickel pincer cofactor biosynthesis protein LarC [Bacteroidota bacterium]
MKVLYYDCFAGISGDMNLGALVDLGVDPGYLEGELGKLNIEGFHLEVKPDMRKGISGTKVTVVIESQENEQHRHLRHIEELINESSLSDRIKQKSLAIFDKVAVAEAKVHNISKEKVHFHEVGALDSIADIVGAAICQEYLEVDEIRSSPVQLGGGFVKCAHGMMPVPAPATAEIVVDMPVKTGLVDYEATTPTGAAILAATVDQFVSELDLSITKTGYGVGQKDGEIPNVLRVYLGESEAARTKDMKVEDAVMLECNIDDMNPEWYTHISDLLFKAGAAEVYITPVVMKKSRPGHLLSVLSSVDHVAVMKDILFRETASIGLREYTIRKSILRREMVKVQTKYGMVDVKRCFYKGAVVNEKPEFEQCHQLAIKHKVSLEEIRKEVNKNL